MSAFARTFRDLKNSEFYKEPDIRPIQDEKKDSASGSTSEIKGPASSANNVLVNPRQRGNPLLKSIRNVPWEYEESLVPDYVMGQTTCALFLSLRYHILNPDYIHERLKLLGKLYELRVLLVQVDSPDPHHALKHFTRVCLLANLTLMLAWSPEEAGRIIETYKIFENKPPDLIMEKKEDDPFQKVDSPDPHHALKHLTRVCLLANLTLMLAWSPEEAGRIIETYKIFENKPPDLIMEKKEDDPFQKLINALTSVRSVNKTDANTLLSNMGSMERIIKSSKDELALCPGLGPQKATRLYKVLHMPFIREEALPIKSTKSSAITKAPEEERTEGV